MNIAIEHDNQKYQTLHVHSPKREQGLHQDDIDRRYMLKPQLHAGCITTGLSNILSIG